MSIPYPYVNAWGTQGEGVTCVEGYADAIGALVAAAAFEIHVWRITNQIMFSLSPLLAQAITESGGQIVIPGALPDGFRPLVPISFPAAVVDGAPIPGLLTLRPDGSCEVGPYAGFTQGRLVGVLSSVSGMFSVTLLAPPPAPPAAASAQPAAEPKDDQPGESEVSWEKL